MPQSISQKIVNHKFIINGTGSAFLRIFGCTCNRCTAEIEQINCSASLISFDEQGKTAHHVLFDIGEGVATALSSSPYLQGEEARLDWLCLTHWHPDHTKDINRLLASHVITHDLVGRTKQEKVKLFCRSGTADWLWKLHDYELQMFTELQQSGEFLPSGQLLPPVPVGLPDITITPITVSHRNADMNSRNEREKRPCCCGYVVQSKATKLVLLWDIDSENGWLERPFTPEQETAVSHLTNADHIFFDCTFWKQKEKPKNHASFDHIKRYAKILAPKHSWLVHVTGHVEGIGNPGFGWTNDEWTENAQRVWQAENLPGTVAVPPMGLEIELV